jgi:RimJ/RimL family protein N-acetyltransferase
MARFEPLRTERLLIRNLEPGDAEAFFAYKRLPEATQYQYWRPQSLEEIEAFIARMQGVEPDAPGEWLQLAVCLKDSGAMVGDVGLHFLPDDRRQAEIGYTISPAHQRKGYATEAVGACVNYLFNKLGKHRVFGSVDPRNAPSIAVLERLGFRKEGHFRQSVYMDGQWQDDCVYAILSKEWNRFGA